MTAPPFTTSPQSTVIGRIFLSSTPIFEQMPSMSDLHEANRLSRSRCFLSGGQNRIMHANIVSAGYCLGLGVR